VIKAGEHEVQLKYACAKADIGSQLRVEVGGESLTTKITKSFSGPMLPSADHIHRKEVYEREWGTIIVGDVRLKKGLTQLKVRALEIAGSEALELKAVHLIRKR